MHMCPLPGFQVPGKSSRVSGKASSQAYVPLRTGALEQPALGCPYDLSQEGLTGGEKGDALLV